MTETGERVTDAGVSPWQDALLVADLVALDPCALGGAIVHGAAGPVRDAWLARLRAALGAAVGDEAPLQRIPCHCSAERLLGGLDLAATLASGLRTQQAGALARADGGVAVLAMAERWATGTAALVAAVMDRGEIVLERDGFTHRLPASFGVVALDESQGDEDGPPAILAERLAFRVDLNVVCSATFADDLAPGSALADARAVLARMEPPSVEIVRAFCRAAVELGIMSLRVPTLALAAARAIAARAGHLRITHEDAALAARLVLAHRARRLPAAPEDDQQVAPPASEPAESENAVDDDGDRSLPAEDVVLAAAKAAIPAGLLAMLAVGSLRAPKASRDGRAGAIRKSVDRGRVIGVQAPTSSRGARLNVLATLQAAAPWQRLRGSGVGRRGAHRIHVRREDFRVNRYKHNAGTTIIFAVDASGSSALHRLAEAKGAVELLLAECYARRDSVALIAFRGTKAEVRLPPSRSLTLAKRSLAGLPGGGGTPLAAGLDVTLELSERARRAGDTPLVVLLTDGRANVARDGTGGRREAEQQALAAGRLLRGQQVRSIVLDTSPQPYPFARQLATEMGGRYVPLPVAGAETISALVQRERA